MGAVVAFLASHEASFINGQHLVVDGALSLNGSLVPINSFQTQ
ncbi:hypothetical protein [Streptomyces acidicola]|nr:hypothetical protein [Streptomyces acidicola]